MIRLITSCFMVFSMLLAAGSEQTKQPVLHASFDKDFRAAAGKTEIEGQHSMKLTMETLSMLLHPGVKGKAAKIGVQEINGQLEGSMVHYPGKYLNPETGTIAFWFKPLNWDFNDTRFHILFDAYGPNSMLTIYKYGDARELYFLFGKPGKSRVIAEAPARKWERGTFRHVIAVWDKKVIRLYIDGILQKTMKVPDSCRPQEFKKFSVGPRSLTAWIKQIGETVIDDLKIYDYALSSAQAEKLFASYGFKKLDKSRIPVKIPLVRMLTSPDRKVLNLTFTLSRTTLKSNGFPVEMEVVLNGKKTVLKKILNSDSSEYQYAFKLAELKDGDYLVNLRPLRETPQDVIENNSFRFTVGNAAQVNDHTVPDPWEPVRAVEQGDTQILTAKMQKTVFGKNIFPVQLYSQTIPLLRSGIGFFCDGQLFRDFSGRKLIERKPDLLVVESCGSNSRFELKTLCRFEFDGMMWFEVTFSPKGKQDVKNARIVIPLRPENSRLYNCFAKDYYTFRGPLAGALKQSVRRNHYKFTDLPVLWMGNEERGLYYFTQDQSGRRLKNRDETIRLDPGKDGATLSINLIDYDSVLDKPVTWKFGLQVTPMRPYLRNRTLWRPTANISLWFPWEKIHNVPDARFKMDDYEKRRFSWSKNGSLPLFHYFAGFSASPENPGFPQHAYDWSLTPPAVGTEVSPHNRQWCYVFVCPNSASYRNTYIRNLEKCIRELKMQYINFDNSWSNFCVNERHGCGWRDEHGKLYPSANILGSRELAKGIYRAARRLYPYGLISRHISQIPEPPLIAFADSIQDGECFMLNVGRDDNYYKIFSPDFFRASFLGHPFGVPSLYIPQFERAYIMHFSEKLQAFRNGTMPNKEKNLRHFIGYFLVHDSNIWPNFGIDLTRIWGIFDRAGVGDDTPFFGYWRKDSPIRKVSPGSERVMVSSYQIPNGFLTVVMNDTDQEQTVSLAAGKAGSGFRLTDAESGVSVNGGSVRVPARDFRLFTTGK